MKFTYKNELYDLFNIIDKENFLSAEENEENVPIILKHGIRQLCEFFHFTDYKSEIIVCQDTKDFGTVMVVQKTMLRKSSDDNPSEPIEERLFVGDGEVNGYNFSEEKKSKFCYPFAIADKRARSRAVLYELGIQAYGEDESESFEKAVRKKKYPFSKEKSAIQTEKTKTSGKAPVFVSSPDDLDKKAKARLNFNRLKDKASSLNLSANEVFNVLKSENCLNVKGSISFEQLTDASDAIWKEAERLLEELANSGH